MVNLISNRVRSAMIVAVLKEVVVRDRFIAVVSKNRGIVTASPMFYRLFRRKSSTFLQDSLFFLFGNLFDLL